MSWPPVTMATQHPDNAGVPWWKDEAFIATQDEIEEMTLLFEDFPIDEYMWDWEGKYVDEAVGEKFFTRAQKLLKKKKLGHDIHLTYRIPAFDGQKMHRMARAFMNILALADTAADIGFKHPPVTEMFLPLTTSADQPMRVRAAFKEIAGYHKAVFHGGKQNDYLLEHFNVTPLVEDVASLLSIEKILKPYWQSLIKERRDAPSGRLYQGQRIFIARSDPAMNSGLIPAVLAVKVALSTAHALGKEFGMKVHPILGTGSLPFRGSVNPLYTDVFLDQYGGTATYSIQSAFRYDYPRDQVKKALQTIKRETPRKNVVPVAFADCKKIVDLCMSLQSIWKPTIESLAPLINQIAAHIPPRRERLQHIGLFGYSRGVGKVRLPRAIGFTAALYSIGVPPELIATGRGLKFAMNKGLIPLIDRYYPALRQDLEHAGKYFNRENLSILAKRQAVFKKIESDVAAIEEILGLELGPKLPRHILHRNLTSTILHKLTAKDTQSGSIERDIVEAGVIRRSLG